MADKSVILVTGVTGFWGSRVAARLANEAGIHVIGLDAEQPTGEIQGIDFIQADAWNPALPDLLRLEQVDTVCHLAFVPATRPREAAFEQNVMGTTRLLGACAQAGVRKVVLKSSTMVYGARPSNSAFLTESHSLRGSRRYGYVRDMVEIEAFCRGYRHQTPDTLVTILRFAGIIGPTTDTPMTRFLRAPGAPSLLGFDPMMQLIHEDDVVEALLHAVHCGANGVFNVAARDVLTLSKIRGLAGKPPLLVFHPVAYWGMNMLGNRRLELGRFLPMDPDYLRYPWVADLTRMSDELGFEPRHTAEEALHEFAEQQQLRRTLSEAATLARSEDRLRRVLQQRQQARESLATDVGRAEEGGGDD